MFENYYLYIVCALFALLQKHDLEASQKVKFRSFGPNVVCQCLVSGKPTSIEMQHNSVNPFYPSTGAHKRPNKGTLWLLFCVDYLFILIYLYYLFTPEKIILKMSNSYCSINFKLIISGMAVGQG